MWPMPAAEPAPAEAAWTPPALERPREAYAPTGGSTLSPPADPETPPSPSDPAPAAAAVAAPTAATVRGLGWASTVGWALAAAGLALAAYSMRWSIQNWPRNFNPGGFSGLTLGIILFVLGAIAAVVFLLVPRARPSPWNPSASPDAWRARAAVARYYWTRSRRLSGIGLGLLLLALALIAYAYRAQIDAGGPDSGDAPWFGLGLGYGEWGLVFLVVSLLGLFLWSALGVRANAYRLAHVAALAAEGATPDPPAVVESADATGEIAGVDREELVALMRRLDSLLAALPEETVASFSKTSEADTYLRILSAQASARPPSP